MSNYYYDILINDETIATVGPSSLKQLHISFGVMNGKPIVKAGGVSETEAEVTYINWFEKAVEFDTSLQVVLSKNKTATNPLMTKRLGRTVQSEEENVCDFCNRTEAEVGVLITLGSSPLICASCAKRCTEISNAN